MINKMLAAWALGFIKAYRFILSPFIGNQCRFTPTCSVYGEEAIKRFGIWRGGWLTLRRIGRCNPYYKGAWVDPVPESHHLQRCECLPAGQKFGTTTDTQNES